MSYSARRLERVALFTIVWLWAISVGWTQELGPYPKVAQKEKGAKGDQQVSIITLGTHKDVVDSVMGTPRSGWTINSLCRSMYTYRDGTTVIFVDRRAISADPSGLALGSPDKGLIVEREGRKIIFEPIVLRGIPLDGPHGALKHDVENSFHFAQPGFIPPPAEPLPWIGLPSHRDSLHCPASTRLFPPTMEK